MNEIELLETIKNAIRFNQLKIFSSNYLDYSESLKKLDIKTLKTLYLYLLSDGKEVCDDIVYFLSNLNNLGNPVNKLDNYISDPVIERIYKKALRVGREIHRMKGFLRFKEVEGGYLYARFYPEFNITMPLANYFSRRLRNEKILIHDMKRNIAAFCYKGKIYSAQINEQIPNITYNEKEISQLWLNYFDKISIKDRLNLKIQNQKVPQKYRKSMIEFKERVR
ncbi:MAG: TIGR03915 family putative DNA repair protein, partial [Thermodesulfovibrio sp.]|nr:TIGR03915 family putative DNA repair protein [Thermodesulfovibrio sp.]